MSESSIDSNVSKDLKEMLDRGHYHTIAKYLTTHRPDIIPELLKDIEAAKILMLISEGKGKKRKSKKRKSKKRKSKSRKYNKSKKRRSSQKGGGVPP